MKKLGLILLAFLLSMVLLAGCGAAPAAAPAAPDAADTTAPAAAEWSLAIEGVDGVTEFTSAEAADFEVFTLDMTVKNKAGEEKTSAYTGVKLADILAAIGVESFTSLSVVASDDFAADYTPELAMADDTLLAWAQDGAALEAPTMSPKAGTGNQFVKNVVKLVVTP